MASSSQFQTSDSESVFLPAAIVGLSELDLGIDTSLSSQESMDLVHAKDSDSLPWHGSEVAEDEHSSEEESPASTETASMEIPIPLAILQSLDMPDFGALLQQYSAQLKCLLDQAKADRDESNLQYSNLEAKQKADRDEAKADWDNLLLRHRNLEAKCKANRDDSLLRRRNLEAKWKADRDEDQHLLARLEWANPDLSMDSLTKKASESWKQIATLEERTATLEEGTATLKEGTAALKERITTLEERIKYSIIYTYITDGSQQL